MMRGFPPMWGRAGYDSFDFPHPVAPRFPNRQGGYPYNYYTSHNDSFLDKLEVKHLKDDMYFVALPRHVVFKHVRITVKDDTRELVFTYLPTNAFCSFNIAEEFDIDRIEAKRLEAEHGILLFIPKKPGPVLYDDHIKSPSVETSPEDVEETGSMESDEPPVDSDAVDSDEEPEDKDKPDNLSEDVTISNLLIAYHPATKKEMHLEEVGGPCDSVLACMGVSVEEACELLLKHQEDMEIRKLVAPEIEKCLVGSSLPRQIEHQPDVQNLRREYTEVTARMNTGLNKAKKKLASLGIPCDNLDVKQVISKFCRVQSRTVLEIVEGLMKLQDAVKNTEKKIQSYCMAKDPYRSFIKFLQSNWSEPHFSLLDAIALLKGLKIYVWESLGNYAKLVHETPSAGPSDAEVVINLLQDQGKGHFTLLEEL